MKFKFPLQKVLEHRKIKEDLAQKDFQDALDVLLKLEGKLKQLEDQEDDARVRSFALQSEGGTAAPSLIQIDEYLRNSKVLLQMQRSKIAEQQAIVENKRAVLIAAAVETKAISTFKDKKFTEFKAKAEKEEQNEMDEQSVLRFKTNDRKDEAS